MSRTAEDILEFDRLRDLLRRQTTCAPGRRAVDALSFSHDRSALDAAFALIAEAVAYLGDGSEMGFGSLADPARWLAELEAPVAVLTPPMLLDAATLADTAAMLRDTFRESGPAPVPPPGNFRCSPRAPAPLRIFARSRRPFAAPSCPMEKSATTPRPN